MGVRSCCLKQLRPNNLKPNLFCCAPSVEKKSSFAAKHLSDSTPKSLLRFPQHVLHSKRKDYSRSNYGCRADPGPSFARAVRIPTVPGAEKSISAIRWEVPGTDGSTHVCV